MNTVAESLVVNEGENGIWLVFWEIKELPGIPTDMIIATTTFQCVLQGNHDKLAFIFRSGSVNLAIQMIIDNKPSKKNEAESESYFKRFIQITGE